MTSLIERAVGVLVGLVVLSIVLTAVALALATLVVLALVVVAGASLLLYLYPYVHNGVSAVTARVFDAAEPWLRDRRGLDVLARSPVLFALTLWVTLCTTLCALTGTFLTAVGALRLPSEGLATGSFSLLCGLVVGAAVSLFPTLEAPGGGPLATLVRILRDR